MKEIKNQHWRDVKFGDEREFRFWSSVTGKGDEALLPGSPLGNWRKIIVLKPMGDLETVFSIGFSSISGDTKVSDATRRIKEGPFGMRMGPEDCDFFISSNDGKIELEIVQYIDIAELEFDLY